MLARLLGLIFPLREDEGIIATLAEEAFLALMEPEVVAVSEPAAVALFPFTEKRVRAAIHEAKYHGNPRAFKLLANALADYLENLSEETKLDGAVLVPVPLGAKRRKERGFNQVEEVLKLVGKQLQMRVEADLLVRTRETASQVTLPRALRKKNMRGAFTASLKLRSASGAELSNHIYIIVDDVLTTGATLEAAVAALTRAGATRILPIALAH